jgi:hypothetical protein
MQPNSPATPEATERAYPYIVEMLVPEGGFGRKLDAMQQFHARHGIQPQGGRSPAKRDATTFDGASPIPELQSSSPMNLAVQSATSTPID